MMIIPRSLRPLRQLLCRIAQGYHIEDLMKRAYSKRSTLLYLPANHLYIDNIIKNPYNEKKMIRVLLEQDSLGANLDNYKMLFQYVGVNVDKMEELKSVAMVMQIGYELKYEAPQLWEKIAKRGFEMMKNHQNHNSEKAYSFTVTKMLIAINRLVGIHKFTDAEFHLIQAQKFKPLFITYIVQLFWQNNLQYTYTFPRRLISVLIKNQQLIPFSDVHHMTMAKKIIKDPIFIDITERLNARLKKRVATTQQEGSQAGINPQITKLMYEEYMNDLHAKYL